MAKKKKKKGGKYNFYAVRAGWTPGIYTDWSECEKQTKGFSNHKYEGFMTREEAEEFLRGSVQTEESTVEEDDRSEEEVERAELPEYKYVYDQRLEDYCNEYFPGRQFNDAQKAAIQYVDGHSQLFAIPGSGKTTVMVARVGYLTHVKKVDSKKIMSVTFNKNAAEEMGDRYDSIFRSSNVGKPSFRTIHSLCHVILKSKYKDKMPELIQDDDNGEDRDDKGDKDGDEKPTSGKSTPTGIMREVLKKLIEEKGFFEVRIIGEYDEIENILSRISYIRNKCLDREADSATEYDFEYKLKIIAKKSKEGKDKEEPIELNELEILQRYRKALKDKGVMDFDELLSLALEHLEGSSTTKGWFEYLNVDEGQDTSKLQHLILKKVVGEDGKIFMVGDDDQSIYGFRGAEPRLMLDFGSLYPTAKKISMGINYRSDKKIIQASNNVISFNEEREKKSMSPHSTRDGETSFVNAPDMISQYQYITKRAKEYSLRNESLAVICKKNISLMPLFSYLRNNGLQFKCSNNSRIREVKNDPLFRMITGTLRVCIGDYEVYKTHYPLLGLYLRKDHLGDIEKMRQDPSLADDISALELVKKYMENKREDNGWSYKERIELVNDYLKMRSMRPFDAIMKIVSLRIAPAVFKIRAVRTMISILLSISYQFDTIEEYLKDLDSIGLKKKDDDQNKIIHISTIHAAKGKEFDHVIIVDSIHEYLMGLKDPNEINEYDEEQRRIFYVAMTRARHTLDVIDVWKRFLFIEDPSPYVCEYVSTMGEQINNIVLPAAFDPSVKIEPPKSKKFYAYVVTVGGPPGLYSDYDDCQKARIGISRNQYNGIEKEKDIHNYKSKIRNIAQMNYLNKRDVRFITCHMPLDEVNRLLREGKGALIRGSMVSGEYTCRYSFSYPSQQMVRDMSETEDQVLLRLEVNAISTLDGSVARLSTPGGTKDLESIPELFEERIDYNGESVVRSLLDISDECVTDSRSELIVDEGIPSYCLRQIIVSNMDQYQRIGKFDENKVKLMLDPFLIYPMGRLHKWAKGPLWTQYDVREGNELYENSYYADYSKENELFFNYLLNDHSQESGPMKIAIFGGGNGWELDAINLCLLRMKGAPKLECKIVDRIIWPINHIDENKGKMIETIDVVRGDIFNYLRTIKHGDYDLLYFSRCINYVDTKDTERLTELSTELSRVGTRAAFAQIELDKWGKTKEFNDEFKRIFGFDEGLRCEELDWPRTRLYERDF